MGVSACQKNHPITGNHSQVLARLSASLATLPQANSTPCVRGDAYNARSTMVERRLLVAGGRTPVPAGVSVGVMGDEHVNPYLRPPCRTRR